MQIQTSATSINRNYEDLAPFFAKKLKAALEECRESGLEVDMFEGVRNDARQRFLYESSRTRKGPWLTNASSAEKSYHAYGVGADLCFKWNGKWGWDKKDPWDRVHVIFKKHGFETIPEEKAHVQITGGLHWSKCSKIAREQGLLHLWSIIEANCT